MAQSSSSDRVQSVSSQPAQTLLAALQRINAADEFAPEGLHPFSASAQSSIVLLTDLIQVTDQTSHSLATYMSLPFSNPKVISLLRQHASIASAVHSLEQNAAATISALRTRHGINYGEDIPSSPQALQAFCISHFDTWATAVGMQVIKDVQDTITFAGNILVIDIEISTTPTRIDVVTLKVSYAVRNPLNGMLTTEGPSTLNELLKRCIHAYLEEVQGRQDPVEAERRGDAVGAQLAYLMMLDKLAAAEGDAGVRWFKDSAVVAEEVAKGEIEEVASSLNLTVAPLDIYLLRAHALPLPFLSFPCLSFLIHLTPRAYLELLRSRPAELPLDAQRLNVDIPLQHLYTHLPTLPSVGATVATLRLHTSHSSSLSSSTEPHSGSLRPSFPLIPISAPSTEHHFPQTTDHAWILDFSQNGRNGVVMSQSLLRAIESLVGRQSALAADGSRLDLGHIDMTDMGGMMFSGDSWVDMLLHPNPKASISLGRYSAFYRSPSSSHPPLDLRLTAPAEPGFRLERVRVKSMREVWGVLEVVREQIWLNGMLECIEWHPENSDGPLDTNDGTSDSEEGQATEAELDAVLNGTLTPRRIPVNVYIPSAYTSPSPAILMTCPERSPAEGLMEIAVRWEERKERGVAVDIRSQGWGLGIGGEIEELEEFCRSGEVWGLAGKIWAWERHGS